MKYITIEKLNTFTVKLWSKISSTFVRKQAGKGLSTNDYTNAEKDKLKNIENNANRYAHPSGDGNLHVPATGATNNGKVLKAGDSPGLIAWGMLDKNDVGLGNIDNTSDMDKPVSTAAQSALNGKADVDSPTLTGTPKAPTVNAEDNTTQIATTAFVQAAINKVLTASEAMVFKGTIGSGGTITSLPAKHQVGDVYKVRTAATYAGVTCEVGDLIICVTSGTSANNTDWTVVQTNIDGAVTISQSSVINKTVPIFDGISGKIIKSSGFTINASVPENAKFTDTTYGIASSSIPGLMSEGDKNKLDGIAIGANRYVHPKYTAHGSELYKITIDETGHISAIVAVQKSDITNLGIPAQDTTYGDATTVKSGLMSASDKIKLAELIEISEQGGYTHPLYPARTNGLYKVTVDAQGHVSDVKAVTKADIVALGIPGQDTNTTYALATASLAGLLSAADFKKLAKITEAEASYLAGVTSAIQTQLNGKAGNNHSHSYAPVGHTHTKSQISDFPLSLKNPYALTISLNGTSQGAYDGSAEKPININYSNVGAAAASHTHTKTQVGLGNVDNTADSSKNVLSATKLATARTLTIGSAGKSFNGTANVAWTLAEIGIEEETAANIDKIIAGTYS